VTTRPAGTRPLRIAVVEFSPSGGLYQFALQMADAYAAAGHRVELVTGRDPELAPREPGVVLRDVLPTWHPAAADEPAWLRTRLGGLVRKARRALRAARLVLAWIRLAVLLLRSRPDVVQWAEWRFVLDGWFVRQIVRLLDATGAAPVHADVAHTPKPFEEQRSSGELYRMGGPLLRELGRAYRAMDVVLVLGDSARRDLEETFPGLHRVEVIPHGDEAIFAAGSDVASRPPSGQGPRILFFGTLARYKGVEGLLDAFALVRRDRPDAELVVAGAVADVDLAALRASAERVGGVDLRPGYVPANAVAPMVEGARVVVAPYVLANQSGVVHLAQTFARPVVATDVGDLGVAVRDGETGLLVPPGDPDALAGALLRLLGDDGLADRMGAAGLERSRSAASWSTVAERVLPVYAELRAGSGADQSWAKRSSPDRTSA
jgi:glycosyltransferase involved in cell wall biosynthesis